MQVQSILDVLQIPPRDLADAAKSVPQRALVDGERLRGVVIVRAAIQIVGGRRDQIGVHLAVVAQQRTQTLHHEVVEEQLSIPVDRGVSGDLRFGVLIAV